MLLASRAAVGEVPAHLLPQLLLQHLQLGLGHGQLLGTQLSQLLVSHLHRSRARTGRQPSSDETTLTRDGEKLSRVAGKVSSAGRKPVGMADRVASSDRSNERCRKARRELSSIR
jgi:uncharacterized protein RhaS with RHS repeats